MSSNSHVTPVPVPTPGLSHPPPQAQDLQAPQGAAPAANRNVSPSSTSTSSVGEASGRKMKRTGAKVNVRPNFGGHEAPPWALSLLKSQAGTAAAPPSVQNTMPGSAYPTPTHSTADTLFVDGPPLESPEPARIVSDIVLPDLQSIPLKFEDPPDQKLDEMPPKKMNLAQSAKIQALQQSWATGRSPSNASAPGSIGQKTESPDQSKDWLGGASAGAVSSKVSNKRSLTDMDGGDSKRRLTNTGTSARSSSENITTTRLSSVTPVDPITAASGAKPERHRRRHRFSASTENPNLHANGSKASIIPITRTAKVVESSDDEYADVNAMEEDDDTTDESEIPMPPPVPVPTSSTERLTELKRSLGDGRLYSMWRRPDGSLESAKGALLPTGYELYENGDFPFICPVRTCRNVFFKLYGLGPHFAIKHRMGMFNDNLDGTLSAVVLPRPPNTPRHPIIVSRNPLRGDEPPMAEPSTPGYKPLCVPRHPVSASQPTTASNVPNPQHHPPQGDGCLPGGSTVVPASQDMTLYAYLAAHLAPTFKIPIERPDIKALLKLTRKRDLPQSWTSKHMQVNNLAPLAVLSLLVYLTGDLVSVPCTPCITPSVYECVLQPCIVLSAEAPSWLKETVNEACATCQWRSNHKRCRNYCNFVQKKTPSGIPAVSAASTPAAASSPAPLPEFLSGAFPYAPAASSSAPSIPIAGSPAVAEPTSNSQAPSSPRPNSPPRRLTRHSAGNAKVAVDGASRSTPVPTVTAMPGNEMPADLLEMEDWEMAPGRVRDQQSANPSNVAFSNAYLTTNQAVSVSEDISFNVIVLKPGSTHRWTEERDKLRICSLATGKLHVKLDKTEPFHIGPNGMFKVNPEMTCAVENRLYVDAVIHVTTIVSLGD